MTRRTKDRTYREKAFECPRCGAWDAYNVLELFSDRNRSERPDDWTRFLPWNLFGPMETWSFTYKQCENCGHQFDIEQHDL